MRRLLAVLALGAVLVACSEQATSPNPTPSFSATSDWTEHNLDYGAGNWDWSWYAACIDDYVVEAGPGLQRFHTVTTDNGLLFSMQWRPQDGYHLLGARTGIWVPAGPNKGELTERIPGTVGSYVFHYTLNFGFVNATSGVKTIMEYRPKVTTNANGQTTVDRVFDGCHIAGKS
jgi:hypothetical protein